MGWVRVGGKSSFFVLNFGKKTIRQCDSGNTEWSRTEKPLGNSKLF